MRFVDFFSGIGGFRRGFELAGGFECVAHSEIDPYCEQVYQRHWPGSLNLGDITEIEPEAIPPADLWTCGDPCQGNSNAGQHHRQQSSPADAFVRLAARCRPTHILRENPAAEHGEPLWGWRRFRLALERLGYAVLPFRLRACCVGAHHQRERLFLLASMADARSEGLERRGVRLLPTERMASQVEIESLPVRASDGLSAGMVRDRIRALGNAITPQQAEFIARRIPK